MKPFELPTAVHGSYSWDSIHSVHPHRLFRPFRPLPWIAWTQWSLRFDPFGPSTQAFSLFSPTAVDRMDRMERTIRSIRSISSAILDISTPRRGPNLSWVFPVACAASRSSRAIHLSPRITENQKDEKFPQRLVAAAPGLAHLVHPLVHLCKILKSFSEGNL